MPHSEDQSIGFLDHLEELRTRLIKCLLALALAFLAGYFIAPPVQVALTRPLAASHAKMQERNAPPVLTLELTGEGLLLVRDLPEGLLEAPSGDVTVLLQLAEGAEPVRLAGTGPGAPILFLRVLDPFIVRLQVALVLALVIALPVILYQSWAFVAPGLVERERRFALPLLTAGTLLFPAGAIFAYFLFGFAFEFLSYFAVENTAIQVDSRSYLAFTLTMMIGIGAVFELPLGIVLATRTGLLRTEWLAANRKYIFVVLLILAALITPADPFSMVAMILPLMILFEAGLLASRLLDKGREDDDRDDRGDEQDDTSGEATPS